jgi:hypothetical protein
MSPREYAAPDASNLSTVPGFEVSSEGIVNAVHGAGYNAENCPSNHVCRDARLDRGLGVDNRRGRWRRLASLDERTMAADKRLVRAALRCFGLSRDWLALKKICGRSRPRLCSIRRRCILFCRGESCFGRQQLIRVYVFTLSTRSSAAFRKGFISGKVEMRRRFTSSPRLFSINRLVRSWLTDRS